MSDDDLLYLATLDGRFLCVGRGRWMDTVTSEFCDGKIVEEHCGQKLKLGVSLGISTHPPSCDCVACQHHNRKSKLN